MFKKPIKLGGQNQLSGKDKKTIKNKLVAQFDPQTVDKLFATHDKIICNKISGSKMLIYVSDEYPLFVDGTGKEEYFLSVYTGAAYEPLSKRLYINEGVEGYIFNGANLMWPGVKDLSRLGNFKKDEIVSIVNSNNEVIAIGAMGCSLDELKANPDGSGIAVYILHFRGDKLWDLGNKVYPEVVVKVKQPKVEAMVEQPVVQPKVQVKPILVQQSKIEKEDSDEQPEEPVKEKGGKGKKDKRVSFNQEEVEQVKPKGKGKKQKKVESDEEQPVEAAKGKGKGKKDKKADSDEEKPEQPVKGKGKGKKQDKKVDSDDDKPQEPAKGKGKNKKEKEKKQQSDQQQVVVEAPKGKGKGKKQTKQQKPQPKKKQESEQSDNEVDFGNLVHEKQPQRVQVKVQKKVIQFSDEEDDKKGKKKGGRKANKKKQSDDEEYEPPKPAKGKKVAEGHDSDEEQEKQSKAHQKKGKGKKQQSDEEEKEQEKPEKKKPNKKGKGKKEQSDEEEEQAKQEKTAKVQQGEEQNEQGVKSAINGQLMDEYFKEAFLNVLKLSKVQGELPIDSGRFFSDYMILARPEGVKLEIKDTTYKKLGKFYEEMAKKKFIEFKPAKEKKGQQGSTITKIFWENEELKNYFPTIKKMGDKDVEQKVEEYSKQKLKLTKTLEVEYVYKLNEQLKKILLKKVINYMPDKSEDEEKEEKKQIFFTEKELKEKIEKFINDIAIKDAKEKEGKEGKQAKEGKQGKQGKQGKDKQKKTEKVVTLNYKQNEFIYGLLKREIEEYEQNLQKEEMMAQHDSDEDQKKKGKKDKNKKSLFRIERGLLVNKIFKLASPHYNISDKSTGLNKFKEGTFKGIQLIADKVINKNVTKIIGIESFAPSNVESEELVKQIHGFAHQLQVKFASSATVQNLPGKNAGKEIVVQGNFVDELEALFMAEFGIKKDYITIQNKLGKKKKN